MITSNVWALIAREAIRHGYIDPRGKSDQELITSIRDWVKGLPKNFKVLHSIDHRTDLLALSREYREDEKHESSLLLMAAWTEHWVNCIVDARCIVLGVSDEL